MKKDRFIAVNLGASKVVLAEFQSGRGNTPEMLKYGISPIEGETGNESDRLAYIVTSIRDLVRSLGIRPAPMIMSVSGQAVFPRFVKLPPVGTDKLDQIVQYEAEQNVPFPIEEVVWDYELISDDADDLNVMLVAAKIENIKRLTDCVQAAELEPDLVDVSPMALYNAVAASRGDAEGCAMILDIGARSSNLVFVEPNRVFSRSIPVAGNTITQELMKAFEISFEEAEALKIEKGFVAFGGVTAGSEDEVAEQASKIIRSVLTRLHAEVNRSVNFYHSQQSGTRPDTVILTGGSSMMPHVDTFFQEKLKFDVEYLNPFEVLQIGPEVDRTAIEHDVQYLGEIAGLALRHLGYGRININLMPPDLVAMKQFRKRKPFFALAVVSSVLIMLCWWGYLLHAGKVLGDRAEQVQGVISGMNVKASALARVQKSYDASKEQLGEVLLLVDQRTQWIELINSVGQSLYEGMWVTRLAPVVEGNEIKALQITVQGFADKLEDNADGTAAERLRDRLRSSAFFTEESEIVREMAVGSYLRQMAFQLNLQTPLRVE